MSGGVVQDVILGPGEALLLGGVRVFAYRELACRGSGLCRLDSRLVTALLDLRAIMDRPMILRSACRGAAHNASIGGHPRSLHLGEACAHGAQGACAVDVARGDPAFNVALVELALDSGWSVGLARSFIHLDRRGDLGLPLQVFGYGGG